jgi:hypothetical protein
MPKEKPCDHQWVYDGKSCCYRLKCTNCTKRTTAYNLKGPMPNIGDPVRLVGEMVERIGSGV